MSAAVSHKFSTAAPTLGGGILLGTLVHQAEYSRPALIKKGKKLGKLFANEVLVTTDTDYHGPKTVVGWLINVPATC